jgi:hypothetical protein
MIVKIKVLKKCIYKMKQIILERIIESKSNVSIMLSPLCKKERKDYLRICICYYPLLTKELSDKKYKDMLTKKYMDRLFVKKHLRKYLYRLSGKLYE